jgi:hypothetical protein
MLGNSEQQIILMSTEKFTALTRTALHAGILRYAYFL